MSRILVHTAVPDAKREIAADMAHLSGNPNEHSVECNAVPGGPSALWDASQGYNGKWWGASQAYAPHVAQEIMQSGYMLGTESWYVAYWEDSLTPAPGQWTNADPPPASPSFDAFLTAIGLQKVVPDV